MCDYTLVPTAIITLIGSLACCTVMCEWRKLCACTLKCESVLIGLLLSHGTHSLLLWITAFSRIVCCTRRYQLAAYYYTSIQLGEAGLDLCVASSEPQVGSFSKALIIFPISGNICIFKCSFQNLLCLLCFKMEGKFAFFYILSFMF